MQSARLIRRPPQAIQVNLCSAYCSLHLMTRALSTSHAQQATGGSNSATPNPMHSAPPGTTKRAASHQKYDPTAKTGGRKPGYAAMSATERAAAVKRRADEALAMQEQKRQQGPRQGGLAQGNIFEEHKIGGEDVAEVPNDDNSMVREDRAISKRSPSSMAPRIDPNPNARARWTRMMVIRNVRRRGRLTRAMRISRTERAHLSKSRFFETSVKKLAPLARQIAGKTLDEAILQMRFSNKKAAREVHKHLLQARNEAVVTVGMGMGSEASSQNTKPTQPPSKRSRSQTLTMVDYALSEKKGADEKENSRRKRLQSKMQALQEKQAADVEANIAEGSSTTSGYEIVDPSNRAPFQRAQLGEDPRTKIYIAEAWVNRGTYEKEGSPRARGRMDILRHPYTGISVVLKEEQTRTRENREKQIKAIRKRLNGKLWTQMPDRPITRQSQHVLW